MKRFAQLFARLDATTKTNRKVAAMEDYFRAAPPADAAWAVYFLCGRRLKRLIGTRLLRQWAAAEAGIADWLFDESYQAVGDLAETIALVVCGPADAQDTAEDTSLSGVVERYLLPLRGLAEEEQHALVRALWHRTDTEDRLVAMKLLTGGFRVGVSRGLVTLAVAAAAGVPAETVAHRLMGNWEPTAAFYERLIDPDSSDTAHSQPYPFCLAHPVDTDTAEREEVQDAESEADAAMLRRLAERLGSPSDYLAEWKWDGIRGQVIRRAGRTFVWSRGGELMEDRWPEIEAAATQLPSGTVLDGEILAVVDGRVLPFAQLQRRINRKQVGKKLLAEVPIQFRVFDLLELSDRDLRGQPLAERRARLEELVETIPHPAVEATEVHRAGDWQTLAEIRRRSRQEQSEGLMLKHLASTYEVGRVRGAWWKWKVAPYTIDAVLIYAQAGHGRRANLFTDYTFAVWQGDQLVPFAKAYSGLSDAEIREVDRFVRQRTRERFGPVRSVDPELVMELAFEGLQPSTRHKSGVSVRFPRIVRWRRDKRPADANTLGELKALAEL